MEEIPPFHIEQRYCVHKLFRQYKSRNFDILKGFEIVAVRCLSCHKIIELKIRALEPISQIENKTMSLS